jgi:hypothetical protein
MSDMTSLTRIAIAARRVIRYLIFLIIFLVVGKFVLDAGTAIYKKAFPAPPPAPTVKYGKLSPIPFPANGSTAKLTYTLETPEGGLPTGIPTQSKVYFMPKPSSNLLSLDTAKTTAGALGFGNTPQQVTDTMYIFNNPNAPSALQMNIITGTFSISYNLAQDKSPLTNKPPIAEIAASEFRSILSGANILPPDLTGPTNSTYLKLSNGQLITALSLSESDVVKVNLFRKNYDNLPSVTGIPDQANVWGMISGSGSRDQQIVAAEFHYFPVDESQYSTYPIKTPTEALTELQANKAYIAALGLNKDGDSLKIRRMYLAYFDPGSVTEFYQPIYVFEGDNGFKAYLPAVTSAYYGP